MDTLTKIVGGNTSSGDKETPSKNVGKVNLLVFGITGGVVLILIVSMIVCTFMCDKADAKEIEKAKVIKQLELLQHKERLAKADIRYASLIKRIQENEIEIGNLKQHQQMAQQAKAKDVIGNVPQVIKKQTVKPKKIAQQVPKVLVPSEEKTVKEPKNE